MGPSSRIWLATACLLAVTGCGSSSSTNVTGPTVVRCAVTIGAEPITAPAAGTSGQFAVGANRECTWTASSEVGWVTLTSGATGQGDAQVGYRVAANPQPTPRKGAIIVNQERLEVSQAAATCQFSIAPASESFAASGGTREVAVSTQGTCAWTARSDEAWITVEPEAGTGSGTVTVRVSANAGAARSGTVVIARQTFTVSQSAAGADPAPPTPPSPDPSPTPPPAPPAPEPPPPSCTVQVAPQTLDVPSQTGGATLDVTASDPSCPWTATSNAGWITVTAGGSGSGNGEVALTIAANPEPTPRSGTLTVAGRIVTVNQAASPPPAPTPPSCTFTVSPTSDSFGPRGGNERVEVNASDSECAWTAASSVSWIVITSGATGTGNGDVQYTVEGNTTTAARTGTLRVAGQTVTIAQEAPAPCEYSVTPTTLSAPVEGRPDASVDVDTAGGCTWTATSNDSWIVITDGATGTGDDRVRFSVLPSTLVTTRTGTLTVAGTTVTVQQEGLLGAVLDLEGTIAGLTGVCPVLSFTLADQGVRTDASTNFTGGSCSSLDNGREVDVVGTVQGDGAVLASSVRRE